MSTLHSKLSAVKFEPVPAPKIRVPSEIWLIFGVIYPGVVVGLELVSRMCANAFFDPMPTYGHALAAAFVPASNLMVWIYLQDTGRRGNNWVLLANGAAITIAACYALLFLPLLPLALLATIVLIGFGPLAPLSSLICAMKLCAALRERAGDRSTYPVLIGGLVAGLGVLIVLDLPAAATRLGIQWALSSESTEQERGLALLRTLGDDDLLLRLSYGGAGQPAGLLSGLLMLGNSPWRGPQQIAISPTQAREIYWRVHGVPFNAKPAPFGKNRTTQFAEFQFDSDHGGTQVGGRLNGLNMVSSRIDGSISGDDAVAYLEWTVEFRNSAPIDHEVRLQLALPPGGVVSRATLWVNGEEREAAYGGRGEVRAAYQKVAVQQRRDPLLVTTKGADRVLAQAFPVPRAGGTIKFKIGMTAPLEITESWQARLTLPAIVDRNFSFPADMRHEVWIESKQAVAGSTPGLTATSVVPRLFRISGSLDDGSLARTRPTISVERNPKAATRLARLGDGEAVLQEITQGRAEPGMPALLIVIDGSRALAGRTGEILRAIGTIASGNKVGVIIASEPMQQLPLAPWSDAQKRGVAKLLRSVAFKGGQDNAAALAEALQRLETESNATLLWIHGPQPVALSGSGARLEQAAGRLSRLPSVLVYGVEPGPNEVLPDVPWAWSARSLPSTGRLAADLADFFRDRSGQQGTFTVRRTQAATTEGHDTGSDHIARL